MQHGSHTHQSLHHPLPPSLFPNPAREGGEERREEGGGERGRKGGRREPNSRLQEPDQAGKVSGFMQWKRGEGERREGEELLGQQRIAVPAEIYRLGHADSKLPTSYTHYIREALEWCVCMAECEPDLYLSHSAARPYCSSSFPACRAGRVRE